MLHPESGLARPTRLRAANDIMTVHHRRKKGIAMEMKVTLPEGTRVDAEYKSFLIRTDQPERKGGTGSAPAPFDYFIASIATCAGIYVLDFFKQRELSTEGLELTVSTVKDRERRRLSEIVIKLSLPPWFPEKYEAAIVRAVDLCSVKKHILEPPAFKTIVVIGGRAAA
jgi:ribosomal protein S12 methylthiotransferase accessory factor